MLWLWFACTETSSTSLEEYDTLLKNWSEFEKNIDEVPVEQRDIILLQLAVKHPTRANKLCHKVESSIAQEKCQQVIGRPHLQQSPPSKK